MKTREEFLAERRKGIGGSDVAALLGISPYKTTFQLWLEKTNRAPIEELKPEHEERLMWGNVLENVIAQEYATRVQQRVQRVNRQLVHPDFSFAVANVDRFVVPDGSRARWDDKTQGIAGADRVLEIKTAHAFAERSDEWGEPGTDEVPQHYWLQVQWYQMITKIDVADLAVLFGGQKMAVYTITADKPLASDLLRQGAEWWERHVVADVPPDPTNEVEARQRWASHRDAKMIAIDEIVAGRIARIRELKKQIETLEEAVQAERDIVTPIFEDAEALTFNGERVATWKANKPTKKTDWQQALQSFSSGMDIVPTDPRLTVSIDAHTKEVPGSRVLRLITPKSATPTTKETTS